MRLQFVIGWAKKIVNHPVYFFRLGLSFPIMQIGFFISDLSGQISKLGTKIQELGIRTEGEVPDGAW